MARLKFDQIGERLYETGVENGILFTVDDTSGEYEEGVAWNGLTNVEESPSGAEETALYADDMKYLSLRSKEEYGATITAYTYPDAFEECDGSKSIVPGMIAGQQSRKSFGFVYKTLIGNDLKHEEYGYKLHIVYNCTASVSSKSHQTINESPEAVEFSWEIKSNPITVDDIPNVKLKPISTIVIDSTKFTDETAQAKLKAVEDALYGVDPDEQKAIEGSDPTLLSPKEIYDLLKTA